MFDQQHRANLTSAVLTALGVSIEEYPKEARILIRLPTYVPTANVGALVEALRDVMPIWMRVEVRAQDLTIVDAREVVDTEGHFASLTETILRLTGPMGGEKDNDR